MPPTSGERAQGTPAGPVENAKTDIWLKRSEPASIAEVQALNADHAVEAADIMATLSQAICRGGEETNALAQAEARIHGAWIRGKLNLDWLSSQTGLRLTGCKLDQPLTLRDATWRWLVLEECVVPAVWADRATVGTLIIKDSLISGMHPDGALRLASTRVTADLRLTGTRVNSPAGPAVLAAGLALDGSAFMETLDARGSGPGGAVCLTGATIAGDLVLQGARLIAQSGPALNGEILTVKGAAWLDDGFTATGAGHSGAVCLTGARITGKLSLRGASLANASGPAMAADLVTVGGGLMMDRGFSATGAGELAAVRLSKAKIGAYLLLDGATLANRSGPVLAACQLSVQGDMTMSRNGGPGTGFSATGAAGPCTVQLRGASITGHLSLDRATVINYQARDLASDADLSAQDGAVCLSEATIGGDLVLSGATLTSAAGSALMADQLTVKGDAFRSDQGGADFRATGTGDLGAVCLTGAHISGQLSLRGAALTSKNGPAMVAGSATVEGDVLIDLGFTATGAGPVATLGLRAAAIGGRLSMEGGTVTSSRPSEATADGAAECEGAVHLADATVGGDLVVRGAMLAAYAGPALRADHLTVHGDAFRCEQRTEGFRATGSGGCGAVFLAASTVGGQLSLSGAIMTNDSGPALVADSAAVQGGVRLDAGFTATGDSEGQAVVSLAGASIGGELSCIGRAISRRPGVPALDLGGAKVGSLLLNTGFASGASSYRQAGQGSGMPLHFDGLIYATAPVLVTGNPPVRVPGGRQADEWIACLRHSAAYSAQAYQQLAAVYRAEGDEDAARRILAAQDADARERGGLTRFSKARRFARAISRPSSGASRLSGPARSPAPQPRGPRSRE